MNFRWLIISECVLNQCLHSFCVNNRMTIKLVVGQNKYLKSMRSVSVCPQHIVSQATARIWLATVVCFYVYIKGTSSRAVIIPDCTGFVIQLNCNPIHTESITRVWSILNPNWIMFLRDEETMKKNETKNKTTTFALTHLIGEQKKKLWFLFLSI